MSDESPADYRDALADKRHGALTAELDQVLKSLEDQRIQLIAHTFIAGCIIGMIWQLRREIHKVLTQ